jgi:hypothetical protein
VREQRRHSLRQVAMYTSGGNTITMTMQTLDKPSTNVCQTNLSCQQYDNIKLFTHQRMHYLLNLERFKLYTRIHINFAPTCFGLRPSSGSLY